MRMPNIRRSRGFTLVELMVTIAVAAVLLVVATPSFIDFIDKARLRGVADSAVDFVSKARAESVKDGRDVSVAFGGSTTAWCIGANEAQPATPGDPAGTAGACDCSASAASCLVGGQQATLDATSNNGVTVDAATAALTFDNRLGVVSGLGTSVVTFTSPRRTFALQLTVTPLGQVSLCVPASSKRAFPEFTPC